MPPRKCWHHIHNEGKLIQYINKSPSVDGVMHPLSDYRLVCFSREFVSCTSWDKNIVKDAFLQKRWPFFHTYACASTHERLAKVRQNVTSLSSAAFGVGASSLSLSLSLRPSLSLCTS